MVEVLLHVHLAHGGREAAGRAAHALLPPGRRLRLARHVLHELLADGAGGRRFSGIDLCP